MPTRESTSELWAPVLPPRYTYWRSLGSGGRGTVLLVYDCERSEPVALKCPHPGDARANDRIVHEAVLLTRAVHPALPTLFDTGLLADGRSYLTRRWIDGTALAETTHATPLSQCHSLALVERIARAVGRIHACGAVHRDITPQNIIVPIDGAPQLGRASLIDCGMWAPLEDSALASRTRTGWGSISGTPAYMSPEQLTGRGETPASDVYALGAVLYELIFNRPLAEPLSGHAFVIRDVDGELRLPVIPRRLLSEIRLPRSPALQPALRRLLRATLQHDPLERPTDGDAVAQALSSMIGDSR